MKHIILAIIIAFISTNTVFADFPLTNWESYSSLRDINNITVDKQNNIWAGGEGGLFSYNMETETIQEYRNINQLMSLNVTALKSYNEKGLIFVGQNDGYIDIIDSTGKITHITDIAYSTNLSNKKITDFLFEGEKVYISGGFGITVLDINEKVFDGSLSRIGDFSDGTGVNQLFKWSDYYWISTDIGFAKMEIGKLFSSPDSWETVHTFDKLGKQPIKQFLIFNNDIYLITDSNILYKYIDNEFINIKEHYDKIKSILVLNNQLYFADKANLFSVDDGSKITFFKEVEVNIATMVKIKNKEYLAVLSSESGVLLDNYINQIFIQPSTPIKNTFVDLDVDKQGRLWCATNWFSGGKGKGFAMYDGLDWHIFTSDIYSEIPSNSSFKIKCADDGRIFTNSYGDGLIECTPNNNGWTIKNYDTDNSPLLGSSESWCMAMETEVDAYGTAWIVNRGDATPGPVLVSMTSDGKFNSYTNYSMPTSRSFISITIDMNGTKWLGGNPQNGKGLFYFNEMNTPDDKSDDINGMLTSGEYPALLADEHSCIKTDYNGNIWLGTPNGLSVIINSQAVLRNSIPIINSIPDLEGQTINEIMIDPQNRKWLATTNGVWIMDENANDLIAHITNDNSPITDNNIKSLALNEETGQVFFGTDKGLFSAYSLAVKPADSYNITCYPSPFNIKKDNELIISGLASKSEIRILTIDGMHIRTINTFSQKAIWDGKNKHGQKVRPGIYILLVKSADSDKAGVAKIAIIAK